MLVLSDQRLGFIYVGVCVCVFVACSGLASLRFWFAGFLARVYLRPYALNKPGPLPFNPKP